jgi:steroid delta-isomerase-like uncharacterized protein
MSPNANLQLLHRYLDEVWARGDIAAAERFFAPDYVRHGSPLEPPLDRDAQIARLEGFRRAFPDAEVGLEAASADGDLVWFRSTLRGTHLGELMGIAPTQRRVTVALMDLWRVVDGRVAEQWGGPDLLDLARQLGARLTTDA